MGSLAEALRSFILGPYSSGDPALARLFGGTPPAAGVSVTEHTALNLSAVWQAVTIIAGSIASLPLILYKRRQDGGKERFLDHPTYRLLHDEPNPDMSAMVWRETWLAHVLTWGNGYSEIERDQAGRPVALWPLTPDRVTPYRDPPTGRLLYRVLNEEDRGYVTVPPEDMLHLPGLGFDGVCGYSVVRHAREGISLGLGVEQYAAKFFGNGALFGIALEHPMRLSKEAQERLKATWIENHGSVTNAHGVAVLEEGMKANKLSIPPDDAQFLQTRRFQVIEISRWFNLPPHKLRDLEHATFSNIEQQSIEFVTDSLRPWMVRIEQECNRKLVRPLERRIQYVEHLVDGLLRGDIQSRYSAYAVGRQWGWLSGDDVREKENMNPLPNGQGQIYLAPMNMVPADKLEDLADAEVEAKTKPAPAPAAPAAPAPEPEPQRAAPAATLTLPLPAPNGGPPDPAQQARVIAAQRAVFIEGVGRMVRREGTNIRRALRKGRDGFRAWIPEFYGKHEDVFAAAILPAMQAHLSQLHSDKDPSAEARTLAARYCEESRGELQRMLDELEKNPDKLALPVLLFEMIEALVSRWEIERPPHLADAIMAEELAHAIA